MKKIVYNGVRSTLLHYCFDKYMGKLGAEEVLFKDLDTDAVWHIPGLHLTVRYGYDPVTDRVDLTLFGHPSKIGELEKKIHVMIRKDVGIVL